MIRSIEPITLINGAAINFLIAFDAPENYMLYKNFNVIDTLALGLSFNINNTFIKVNGDIIPDWNYQYDNISKEVKINITNNINTAGKRIEVYLAVLVEDSTVIEPSLVIANTAYVEVNEIPELSTASEEVNVYFANITSNEITISPETQNQVILQENGGNVAFRNLFLGSSYDTDHLVYNVVTTIPQGLTFDVESSSVVVTTPPVNIMLRSSESQGTVEVSYVYNSITRILSVNINNAIDYEGMLITVIIGTKIVNREELSNSMVLNMSLGFNNNPQSIISTKAVVVNFINPISLIKTVDNPIKFLENGTKIKFTGIFTVPENTITLNYNNFTIRDTLPSGLVFDRNESSVLLDNGLSIESMVSYPDNMEQGTIAISFNNYSNLQGKVVFVNIGAILDDKNKIPDDSLISNIMELYINGDLNTAVYSNAVIVKFEDYITAKQQALNNVITAIAIVEDALNTLLDTEIDILERGKEIGATTNELAKLNNSIKNVVSSVGMLERYEGQKLEIASNS